MKSNVLTSRDRICDHLGIGKTLFYKLVAAGLPARQIAGGRWMAHIQSIDDWFAHFLKGQPPEGKKRMLSGREGGHPPYTRE